MKSAYTYIRNYYRDQPRGSCLKLLTDTEVRQIVLIRHARPDVERPLRVDFKEAEEYLNAYRQSGIIVFDDPPVCTENLPLMPVYCSTLERARQTAHHIFQEPKFTLIEDAGLRELDRENMRLPFRMSHSWHTRISRIAWLLGIQQAEESFREAMQRVNKGAKKFDRLSETQELIIIVAHGFQNYFLVRKLRKLGWDRVFDNGNEHLSVKILVKQESPGN